VAIYKTDMRDIEFNLFELLKIHEVSGAASKEELQQIVTEFDKFVANEVFPIRTKSDKEGVRLEKDGVKVAACLHKAKEAFYANGWFSLGFPEKWGGMPAPHSVHVATSGLITGANVGFQMYPGLTRAALNVILAIGTDAQKDKLVPPIMSGEWGGTMCLTEPGAGSDVGASATTATPKGNGQYAIKGVKIFISSGESDLYKNNIHMVLARTPGAPEGTKGLSLFIVPRFKINSDGSLGTSNNVHCTKIEEKMGIHCSATCEMSFGQKGDCLGELIGKEGDGMPNMFLMMNEARLMCGMQGESQASLAYELTIQYARERAQFGKELVKHPDIMRLLMRMRSYARGMRSLILYTAHLFDLSHAGQKEVENEIALLTPICKAWCSEMGFNVSVDAVQVHGGYGYCIEYGVEQFLRDGKIATIYEGTNGIQAIDFVMRKILRDQGKTFTALGKKISDSLALATAWPEEVKLMASFLKGAQEIGAKLGAFAQEGKQDAILERCSDFQLYCGNLFVAWRLLESALVSKQKLDTGSAQDRAYYQSKIDDFSFFVHHIAVGNMGLLHSMQHNGVSLCKIQL
jgi:alkylation response protein AidB-like acyl-CoA dehydrogenase